MSTMRDRTVFITGASRGIGRAIALAAARQGANVVIAAKSDTPHPKLPGTIHTVAEEVGMLEAKRYRWFWMSGMKSRSASALMRPASILAASTHW